MMMTMRRLRTRSRLGRRRSNAAHERETGQIKGRVLLLTGVTHAWTFDAELLHRHHEGADELIPTLQAQQFVLPVALVEEDDVEGDGVSLVDLAQLGQDLTLIIALLGQDKVQQTLTQAIDLVQTGAKLHDDRHPFGQPAAAAHVQDEEGVEVAVGRLHHVTLELLELGIEQRDGLDEVIVAFAEGAGVAIDGHAVADVEGMLDEDEDDRLEELLSGGGEEPGQGQQGGTGRGQHARRRGRDQGEQDQDGDDEDEEDEDVVKLGDDGVDVLDGVGDGPLLPAGLDTDGLELLHGDVAVEILVEHLKGGFGFVVVVEGGPKILGEEGVGVGTGEGMVEPTGQGLAVLGGAQQGDDDLVRVGALDDPLTGEILSELAGDVADAMAHLARTLLDLGDVLQRGGDAGALVDVMLLEVGVVHLDLLLGVVVQLGQDGDLELDRVDAMRVGAAMKVHQDELHDQLLDEVEGGTGEDGVDDLVGGRHPRTAVPAAVMMMVGHHRHEGDLNSEPPEEDGGGDLKFAGQVPPFLAVVREDAGDGGQGVGKDDGHDLVARSVSGKGGKRDSS